jgi:hypothetical protein
MNKTRLLIWLVIILAAVNIATIVSALSYSGKISRAEQERLTAETDARVMMFRDYLELDVRQMDVFVQLNRSFSQNAGRTTNRLDMLRRSMINELAQDNPDMKKVDQITAEIGELHRQLKESTAEYYLGLKEVCNPSQRERLREMFVVMSDPESDMDSFRRGRGMQRPGQGRGQQRPGAGRGGRFDEW